MWDGCFYIRKIYGQNIRQRIRESVPAFEHALDLVVKGEL